MLEEDVEGLRASDLYFMAFKALRDRKLRSALTILGIIIGSALIVALIASTGGLSASVSAQIEKIGVTTVSVMSRSIRSPLTDEDVQAVRDTVGVKDVIPYFQRRLSFNYGVDTISVALYGIEQEKLQSLYKGLAVESGGLVDSFDPTGVLVGSTIAAPASDLYPPLNLDGLMVLQGQAAANNPAPSYSFIVKGILAPYGAAGFVNPDETVFVSITAARMVFASVYYSGLYVIADSPDNVESVSTSLQNYFGGDAQVFSSSALLSTVQSISSQLTIFLGSVATVSLFVAGVGITNTMFVSVMERTREIGILKALGYRPRQIMSLFLAEAAVTGMIGSVFGTLFGVGLSYLLGGGLPFFRPPANTGRTFGGGAASAFGASFGPVFSVELIAFSLIFPIGISVLAGLYPAWRASRMNAVAALKYE